MKRKQDAAADTAAISAVVSTGTLLYARYRSIEALQAAAAAQASKQAAALAALAAGTIPMEQPEGEEANGDVPLRPLTKFEIKRLKRAARQRNPPNPPGAAAAGAGAGAVTGAGAGAGAEAGHAQPNGKAASPEPAADEAEQEQEQEQEQGQGKVSGEQPGKTSGKSNADEAQRIRQALGYAGPSEGGVAAGGAAQEAPASQEQPTKKAKKGKKGADANGSGAQPGTSTSAPSGAAAGGKGGFRFGFQVVAAQVEAETEAKLNRIMMVDTAKDGFVPRRVYICGMPHEYDEAALREFWGYCGEIESMDMQVFPDTGNFKGVVFITFKTEAAYEAALACNGDELEGRTVKVEKCKLPTVKKGAQAAGGKVERPNERVEGYNVAFVSNVTKEATKEDVMEFFKSCKVKNVRLHTDSATGERKPFVHVHFADVASLESAMKLNGEEICGQAVYISYAQPPKKNRH